MFRRILRKKYRRAVGTHYGPTRIHQADYSPRHRRDGRAGTTILQLFSLPTTGPRHFPSDNGPDGLLEQGQRRRIRRSRRTVLRDYELSVPQDLSKDHGPTGSSGRRRRLRLDRSTFRGTTGRDGSAGWLCLSTQRQEDDKTTRPSGSGPTSQSDARDFGPKLLHADRPTGRGQGSQITSD